MPFDNEKYYATATRAEVARVALQSSISGMHIRIALQKISERTGVDISEEIEAIREAVDRLDGYFDSLTGYTPDA